MPSLAELRVSQQELHSGAQTGKVYVQHSAGAVAFLTERHVAEARVSRMLRNEIEKDEGTHSNTSMKKQVSR